MLLSLCGQKKVAKERPSRAFLTKKAGCKLLFSSFYFLFFFKKKLLKICTV